MTSSIQQFRKSRWLLLGGAGFIGAHVLREFIEAGADCYVFDNLTTGMVERLPPGVEFILGDATNPDEIAQACIKFEIGGVVHLAAYMQARESVRDPIKFWSNNLGASLALALILEKTKVNHVIFSSSCSVYGNAQGATEEFPLNPMSPYAMTKVASEQVLSQATQTAGIRLTILRYFNVIGCGRFPESFDHSNETILPATLRRILEGTSPTIFGGDLPTADGTAIRDYLDVRDLAHAHLIVACSPKVDQQEIFNVSSGRPISVKEIIGELLEISGSDLVPLLLSAKGGDPVAVWAEESQRLKSLGWSPKYSLRESVQTFSEAFSNASG
jgi:UDP-glucose 4-epimerase